MNTYQEFLENKGEKKWQDAWEADRLFTTPSDVIAENKCYVLPQLPYPSGSGLHVGHAEVYTACDIYARYQRMCGKKVLQVIGWDSFGLPDENYAIKTNVHPRISTDKAINNFREQIKALGISVDWNLEQDQGGVKRESFLAAHSPDYYKWTQWFFLLMYKRGLAYRKKQVVNWCDSCKTVLANDQVVAGEVRSGKREEERVCERCSTVIIQREMEQWYIRTTEYAERLLEGLDDLDWPEETKKRQKDWIGRSDGAEVSFVISTEANTRSESGVERSLSDRQITVFTTRPDTLFGVTYMVLAPEGDYVQQLKDDIENWDEVANYIEATAKKTDLDRQINQEKTGVELKGVMAINPVNNEEIPVYIADYVLASYGTGAIMAVPGHDERDFTFAKKYKIEMREVVVRSVGEERKDEEYRTGAYGIVERDGKILVLYQNEKDLYRLPGGTQENGESVEEGLRREFTEETGYKNIKVDKYIGQIGVHFVSSKNKKHIRFIRRAFIVDIRDEEKVALYGEDKDAYEYIWMSRDEARVAFEKNKVSNKYPHDTGEGILLDYYFEGRDECFTTSGLVVNSDSINGLTTEEAKEKIIEWLEEKGFGKGKVQYKLRDWSVSRQRFWGAPIPMLYDEKGELHPVPEEDLPVILPDDVDFKPTGESPLNYSKSFNNGVEEKYGNGWRREPDTLDTFMCSSWYYFRYLDPKNKNEFASPEQLKKWMPVDFYLGGPEHVNGHLLYARFFTKVLYDAGYIDFDEPFAVHRHQGMILGSDNKKMSKRRGNVVNPTDVVEKYGADTLRMYEMFMGPLEDDKPWDENGVKGVKRFLEKVWKLQGNMERGRGNEELDKLTHKTLKKVGDDLASLNFNTAIAKLMELVNEMTKLNNIPVTNYELLVIMLSPLAPHIADELWERLGNKGSMSEQPWPEYDENKLVEDEITLVVQVNGKVRSEFVVPTDISEDDAKAQALADEKVVKWMEGKEPKKVIYVKGKLISIVV